MTNPTTTITNLAPINPVELTPAAVLPMDGADTITGKVTLQQLANAITGQMDAINPAELTGSSTVTVRGADGKAGVTTMVELTKVITVYQNEGDTSYAGPGGVPTNLPGGAPGQMLVMGAGDIPEWFTMNLTALASLLGVASIPLPVKRVPTVYGSNGTYTFTVPATCTQIEIELWGAGGGSLVGGTTTFETPGGGGGGYVWGSLAVTPGATYTVVVGAGGVGSGAGGTSTFGSTLLIAHGGAAGVGGSVNPAAGGSFAGSISASYGVTGSPGSESLGPVPSDTANMSIGGAGARGGAGGFVWLAEDAPPASPTSHAFVQPSQPGGGGAAIGSGGDSNSSGRHGHHLGVPVR